MLKLAGIFLILLAGTGLGFGRSYELTAREKTLEEILQMIRWLKGEISSRHASLPDAFLGVAQRMPSPYDLFLKRAAEALRSSSGIRMGVLYRQCAEETLKELPLCEKDWEQFFSLGETLGYLDLEMQRKQLEFLEQEFQYTIEALRAELPVRKKLYRSMGMMGGILLAILVW